jgi:hypothetical protein
VLSPERGHKPPTSRNDLLGVVGADVEVGRDKETPQCAKITRWGSWEPVLKVEGC